MDGLKTTKIVTNNIHTNRLTPSGMATNNDKPERDFDWFVLDVSYLDGDDRLSM